MGFYKDGDILLVDRKGWLSGLIKWFQREPNEAARVSHVEMLLYLDKRRMDYLRRIGYPLEDRWLGKLCAIGAVSGGVKIRPFSRKVVKDSHWWVVRAKGIGDGWREVLADIAIQFASAPYSFSRLLLFGVDKLFGTRLAVKLSPGNVVCSYLVAFSYFPIGVSFEGKVAGNVTPDDIWDTVMNTEKWEVIKETKEGG